MNERPNILLIVTDEMRGDCMGIAGHPDVMTPHLDSLADQGVLFTHAYSACPTCVPARAVLHTGLSHVHTGKVGYRDRMDWNYGCTMAGEMTRAGYQTQCVGKMHVHPLRNNIGFENVRLHDGYLHAYRGERVAYSENQLVADDYYWWLKQQRGVTADPDETGLDCNSWVARPWIGEERLHPTNWVVSESIDFLRRRDPRKPFFLMTSFVRPHAPLDAPQVYFDMYENKTLSPVAKGDWDFTDALEKNGRRHCALTGPSDPELSRRHRVGYYACITHIDHQIGRLMIELTERGLAQNTVILFTSDHGDMMDDHGQCQKARPYQGSIHIPLFLSGAERWIGAPRRRDDRLCELRDVMPTLLHLAGAPIPTHLDGQSLLEGSAREWLQGEHTMGKDSTQFIVTVRDKYVWYSQTGMEQYFDLIADPQETHNAIADDQNVGRVQELRKILIHELAGREEGYSDGKHLNVGCPVTDCLSHVRERCCPDPIVRV